MVGQYVIQCGQLSAAVLTSPAPVAVLFVFPRRHLLPGLADGALQG